MKLFLLYLCILAFFSSIATAQAGGGGVKDDSYFSDGNGGVVHVDVTDNPDSTPGNVWVTATDASGFSNAADGRGNPCTWSDSMTTGGGTVYRVQNGHLWKKLKSGKWMRLKKVKGPPKPYGGSATSPIWLPWAGDEVTSLPQ